MALTEVVPGLHQVSLGIVNAFLLQDDGELTLIDAGTGGSAARILAGAAVLGRTPAGIKRILVTHLHADHTGGLAELKRQTGAKVHMHPADAALIRQGIASRPARPAPGLIKRIIVPLAMLRPARVEPVETDIELADGQDLSIAGGLCPVTTPGHAAGHVVFFWPQHGGVLIVGDAASNYRGKLDYPIIFEEMDEGVRSLEKIAALDFQVAVFSHGRPIMKQAADQFRARWGRGK